ncbi:MAG: hypothetical protein AAFQ94_11830 [Bacteroidota bacterium]
MSDLFQYAMKTLLSIFMLLLLCASAKAFHYEVIDAENTILPSTGQPIKRGMKLTDADQIKVKSGYLLLVNSMYQFFEFEGDTSLTMQALTNQVNYRKDQNGFAISKLLGTEDFSIDYKPTSRCDKGKRDIVFGFIHESEYNKIVEIPAEICLFWQHTDQNDEARSFIVQVSNMFGDLLMEEKISENFLMLDLSEYETPRNIFLVQVFTVDENANKDSCASEDIGLKVTSQPANYFPNRCGELTAAKALEIAFHLEYNGRMKWAEKYYKKASSLSERAIYQTIFEKFAFRFQNISSSESR